MAEEEQHQHQHQQQQQQHPSPSSSSSSAAAEEALNKQTQAQFSGLPSLNGDFQTLPIMYPSYFPGFYPLQQNQEQMNQGRGLYAVPAFPFMGPTAAFAPNTLIPFTYNIPSNWKRKKKGQREKQMLMSCWKWAFSSGLLNLIVMFVLLFVGIYRMIMWVYFYANMVKKISVMPQPGPASKLCL